MILGIPIENKEAEPTKTVGIDLAEECAAVKEPLGVATSGGRSASPPPFTWKRKKPPLACANSRPPIRASVGASMILGPGYHPIIDSREGGLFYDVWARVPASGTSHPMRESTAGYSPKDRLRKLRPRGKEKIVFICLIHHQPDPFQLVYWLQIH